MIRFDGEPKGIEARLSDERIKLPPVKKLNAQSSSKARTEQSRQTPSKLGKAKQAGDIASEDALFYQLSDIKVNEQPSTQTKLPLMMKSSSLVEGEQSIVLRTMDLQQFSEEKRAMMVAEEGINANYKVILSPPNGRVPTWRCTFDAQKEPSPTAILTPPTLKFSPQAGYEKGSNHDSTPVVSPISTSLYQNVSRVPQILQRAQHDNSFSPIVELPGDTLSKAAQKNLSYDVPSTSTRTLNDVQPATPTFGQVYRPQEATNIPFFPSSVSGYSKLDTISMVDQRYNAQYIPSSFNPTECVIPPISTEMQNFSVPRSPNSSSNYPPQLDTISNAGKLYNVQSMMPSFNWSEVVKQKTLQNVGESPTSGAENSKFGITPASSQYSNNNKTAISVELPENFAATASAIEHNSSTTRSPTLVSEYYTKENILNPNQRYNTQRKQSLLKRHEDTKPMTTAAHNFGLPRSPLSKPKNSPLMTARTANQQHKNQTKLPLSQPPRKSSIISQERIKLDTMPKIDRRFDTQCMPSSMERSRNVEPAMSSTMQNFETVHSLTSGIMYQRTDTLSSHEPRFDTQRMPSSMERSESFEPTMSTMIQNFETVRSPTSAGMHSRTDTISSADRHFDVQRMPSSMEQPESIEATISIMTQKFDVGRSPTSEGMYQRTDTISSADRQIDAQRMPSSMERPESIEPTMSTTIQNFDAFRSPISVGMYLRTDTISSADRHFDTQRMPSSMNRPESIEPTMSTTMQNFDAVRSPTAVGMFPRTDTISSADRRFDVLRLPSSMERPDSIEPTMSTTMQNFDAVRSPTSAGIYPRTDTISSADRHFDVQRLPSSMERPDSIEPTMSTTMQNFDAVCSPILAGVYSKTDTMSSPNRQIDAQRMPSSMERPKSIEPTTSITMQNFDVVQSPTSAGIYPRTDTISSADRHFDVQRLPSTMERPDSIEPTMSTTMQNFDAVRSSTTAGVYQKTSTMSSPNRHFDAQHEHSSIEHIDYVEPTMSTMKQNFDAVRSPTSAGMYQRTDTISSADRHFDTERISSSVERPEIVEPKASTTMQNFDAVQSPTTVEMYPRTDYISSVDRHFDTERMPSSMERPKSVEPTISSSMAQNFEMVQSPTSAELYLKSNMISSSDHRFDTQGLELQTQYPEVVKATMSTAMQNFDAGRSPTSAGVYLGKDIISIVGRYFDTQHLPSSMKQTEKVDPTVSKVIQNFDAVRSATLAGENLKMDTISNPERRVEAQRMPSAMAQSEIISTKLLTTMQNFERSQSQESENIEPIISSAKQNFEMGLSPTSMGVTLKLESNSNAEQPYNVRHALTSFEQLENNESIVFAEKQKFDVSRSPTSMGATSKFDSISNVGQHYNAQHMPISLEQMGNIEPTVSAPIQNFETGLSPALLGVNSRLDISSNADQRNSIQRSPTALEQIKNIEQTMSVTMQIFDASR